MSRAEDELLVSEVNQAYQNGRTDMAEEITEALKEFVQRNKNLPEVITIINTIEDRLRSAGGKVYE